MVTLPALKLTGAGPYTEATKLRVTAPVLKLSFLHLLPPLATPLAGTSANSPPRMACRLHTPSGSGTLISFDTKSYWRV